MIVGDLEKGGQAAAEHVGRIFRVILNSWLLKRQKKSAIICGKNRMCVNKISESEIGLIQNKH